MNAPTPDTVLTPTTPSRLMSGAQYVESLRGLKPVVYVDGRRIDSVADEPALAPGVRAMAFTYDATLRPEWAPLMTQQQRLTGRTVNRMLAVDESAGDLLNKLEAVRLLCQETGCAQRYLAHDGLAALGQMAQHTAKSASASTRLRCGVTRNSCM
jgi:4-hydroxybutyryl-CoA dehydratase / vinylacetyl-CoA-Delta-isomerase